MTEAKKGKTLYDFSKDIFEKGLAAAGEGKYDEAICCGCLTDWALSLGDAQVGTC